jgi:hypothetical protein
MEQTQNKKATMIGMESFHIQIMEKYPDYRMRKSKTFRDLVRQWAEVEGGRISRRHEKGLEVFYLTVPTCPMDKGLINRILCSWHKKGGCTTNYIFK